MNLALDEITKALRNVPATSSGSDFACRQTLSAADLNIEVTGVGKISLPVTRNRAKSLIKVARQAPFGRGVNTLTDTTEQTSGGQVLTIYIGRHCYNRAVRVRLAV